MTNTNAALPDAVRVPLDSLHADAEYLCARLLDKSLTREEVVTAIRFRIDAAKAALTAAAGVVKESLTAAHALPPGIARDDTVHGEMYYTAAQVRAMLAQAAPQPAAPSERERFERYVKAYTGRDIEYHQRNGTTGLEFGWACWQAAQEKGAYAMSRRARTRRDRRDPIPDFDDQENNAATQK